MAKNVIQFTIKGVDKFSGTLKNVSAGIGAVGKGMVKAAKYTAGAGVALLAFTKVMANGIDKTGKFAGRIGVAVDQLSAMQVVADRAGMSSDQFNMATQRMTRRVAEAAKGMGEAKGALQELGINAENFKNLNLEDQYAMLADKMGNVTTEADKLRLGFKLFDSEGTAVLQMLSGGSEAMKQVANDAAFLGLVITEKAAASAAHFNDMMSRMTGSMTGVSRGIAGELMPLFAGMATKIADAVANSREAIVAFTSRAIENLFVFGAVIGQVMDEVKKIFTDVTAFSNFLDNMGSMFVAIGKVAVSGVKTLGIIIWEGLKVTGKIITEFGSWIVDSVGSWFSNKDAGDFSTRMSEAVFNAVAEARTNLKAELGATTDEFAANAAALGEVTKNTFGIDLVFAQEQAKLAMEGIMEYGTVAAETIKNTMGVTGEELKIMQAAQEEWTTKMGDNFKTFINSYYATMDSAIDGISKGLADTIVEGKSAVEVFKSVGKAMVKEIVASLIKMGIQRLLFSALSKGANRSEASAGMAKAAALTYANTFAATSAIPGGVITAPAVSAGAVAAMQAGAIGAGATGSASGTAIAGFRADGGPVAGGKSYVVGERGPELFTPGSSGGITPNESLGGGVSIGEVNISILPNATNADALLAMDDKELEEVVAAKIIPALNGLAEIGVKQSAIEQLERI